MQITDITIRPSNENLVRAYVDIVFDNCFMVGEIKVIQGPTGLFLSFPTRKLRDGTQRDISYPANTETRRTIEQAILAQYEKVVGGSDSLPRENQKADCK
jgi:stage V sporulation protein G